MRAWLNLRYTVPERRAAFHAGLAACGYRPIEGLPGDFADGDVLVTWNRIGHGDTVARQFEARGLPVLVAENATWGNGFAERRWYTIARGWHNTAGCFPVGGPERWDSLGVVLDRWRTHGETVVLPQRGIGANGMPRNWTAPGRVRRHPGTAPAIELEQDLARAGKVVTWGSGAAVKALVWGIPVESHMPNWIAEQDNTDAGRLAMFRRLAWAQWTLDEIADGLPFRRLLCTS